MIYNMQYIDIDRWIDRWSLRSENNNSTIPL